MLNDKHIEVYIAGDSTVQTYDVSSYPQSGWGNFIGNYFTSNVEFLNNAIGGRSSKSFIKDGRLDSILEKIKEGDYLLIQMGHNDADISKPNRYTEPNVEYKKYLKMYIDGARKYKAIPILLTPVATLNFDGKCFLNNFPDYCNSMKQLALDENVKLIDLMTKSLNYYKNIGYESVYPMFMVSSNGNDHTHFTQKGAEQIARIVSIGLKEIDINISKYVNVDI